MERINRLSSVRLESKSNNAIESYFQRAGSFGHVVIMIGFYALVYALYVII